MFILGSKPVIFDFSKVQCVPLKGITLFQLENKEGVLELDPTELKEYLEYMSQLEDDTKIDGISLKFEAMKMAETEFANTRYTINQKRRKFDFTININKVRDLAYINMNMMFHSFF